MASALSGDRIRFLLNQLKGRLWVKPLVVCLLSIGAAFVAKLADDTILTKLVPVIAPDSIETLLSIMASSMLVIATFSVSSMVSAYASASNTATPRSFTLVVADDASQNALSTFVGAFIFSIVALTAAKNDYFQTAGLFILFVLTIIVFGIVIMMFVRWVDRIARLGRLGTTIEKVEAATSKALIHRGKHPTLCGAKVTGTCRKRAIYSNKVGYIKHIDLQSLQAWAEEANVRVEISSLPGTFASPDRVLAYICADSGNAEDINDSFIFTSFEIGSERLFDDDPRFGLVVLSEIAGRALSPAVNDPGTAISIIGTLLRLFHTLNSCSKQESNETLYNRIEVPELAVKDMFDDAFTSLARDGAGILEVSVRLQKTLHSLALCDDEAMTEAAIAQAKLALKRSELAFTIEEDLIEVKKIANQTLSCKSVS